MTPTDLWEEHVDVALDVVGVREWAVDFELLILRVGLEEREDGPVAEVLQVSVVELGVLHGGEMVWWATTGRRAGGL